MKIASQAAEANKVSDDRQERVRDRAVLVASPVQVASLRLPGLLLS
jgi:hypothetical protein